MAVPAPIILLPTAGIDYTSDTQTQTLSGTTVVNTSLIKVNGSLLGVIFTPGETVWAWTGDLYLGENTLSIVAVETNTGIESSPKVIKITYVETDTFVTVSPPTGIKLKRYQDKIEIICSKNPEASVVGYNYYISTESGGGSSGEYAKINDSPVDAPTFYEDMLNPISTKVENVGDLRVTTTTEKVLRIYYYSTMLDQTKFDDMVNAGKLPSMAFNDQNTYYFVITAVIYDSVLGQVTESTYSTELSGSPISISSDLIPLPPRTQYDVILSMSKQIMNANSAIDLKPGTVLRDTLDPVSEEDARIYIIQDFIQKCLSVRALLNFDDANNDGVSDPVSSSLPKKALQVALNITSDSDMQAFIDARFDDLASNVNLQRKGALNSIGSVVFYTTFPPPRDMTVQEFARVSTQGDLDQGIASKAFQVLATHTLAFADRDQYINPQTKRYEMIVDVEAITAGEIGDTNSDTVTVVGNGADADFSVTNTNAISFGQDQESNHDLATRIELAFASLDTGTEGGYVGTAIGVTGVRKVRVEKAGDSLMTRDYDSIRKKHVGGKVDIYVQGSRDKQESDQFGFSYESIIEKKDVSMGETFAIDSVESFRFRSLNPRVTTHTPIFEILKVRNVTRGKDYDITGYVILGDGDSVDLDQNRPINAAAGLASTDVIKVDYRFRSSSTYILNHQPVNEIISVTGQLSGPLTTENYKLVKLQDPLGEGESTIAQDGLEIIYANGLPKTEFQEILDESHVLLVDTEEPLDLIGADPLTIKITDENKTLIYLENVDYTVNSGSESVATTIKMMETGRIQNGQIVLANYTSAENFIVQYSVNSLLETVQGEIDKMKHACADAVVKQAVENSVDFIITIIPKLASVDQNKLSSKIRTAISNYISQLPIGEALHQSDIINLIENLPEINYVALPLLKMVKKDGSLIIKDEVGRTNWQIFNTGLVASYMTVAPVLTYKTIEQGGPDNMFKAIYENNVPLILMTDIADVAQGPGRGYIRNDGRIFVSTKDGELPDTKDYTVTYWVYGETGANDILVASVEHLTVGTLSIIYSLEPNKKQGF